MSTATRYGALAEREETAGRKKSKLNLNIFQLVQIFNEKLMHF